MFSEKDAFNSPDFYNELGFHLSQHCQLIRIIVPQGNGNGHHVAAVHVLEYLKIQGFKGKIELIYKAEDIEKVIRLFDLPQTMTTLEPYVLQDQQITFFTVSHFLKWDVPIADLVIMPSRASDNESWLIDFKGRVGIGFSPYLFRPSIVYTDPPQQLNYWNPEAKLNQTELPFAIKWPIPSLKDCISAIAKNQILKNKPGLLALATQMANQTVLTAPVYGLGEHNLGNNSQIPQYAISTLLLALAKFIQEKKELFGERPALLLLMNDFTSSQLNTMLSLCQEPLFQSVLNGLKMRVALLSIEDEHFEENLKALPPDTIALTVVGALPANIFDALLVGATLPPVSEGASALVTALSAPTGPLVPLPCASRVGVNTNLSVLSSLSKQTEFLERYQKINDKLCRMNHINDYDPTLYDDIAHFWLAQVFQSGELGAEIKTIQETYNDDKVDLIGNLFKMALSYLVAPPSKSLTLENYDKALRAIKEGDLSAIESLLAEGVDFLSSPQSGQLAPIVIALTKGKFNIFWAIVTFNHSDIDSALKAIEQRQILLPAHLFNKAQQFLSENELIFTDCSNRYSEFEAVYCSKLQPAVVPPHLNTGLVRESYQSALWWIAKAYHQLQGYISAKKDPLTYPPASQIEWIRLAIFFNDKKSLKSFPLSLYSEIAFHAALQSKLAIFKQFYTTAFAQYHFNDPRLVLFNMMIGLSDVPTFKHILSLYKAWPAPKVPLTQIGYGVLMRALNNPHPHFAQRVIGKEGLNLEQDSELYLPLFFLADGLPPEKEAYILDLALGRPQVNLFSPSTNKRLPYPLLFLNLSDELFNPLWAHLTEYHSYNEIREQFLIYIQNEKIQQNLFHWGKIERLQRLEAYFDLPAGNRFKIPVAMPPVLLADGMKVEEAVDALIIVDSGPPSKINLSDFALITTIAESSSQDWDKSLWQVSPEGFFIFEAYRAEVLVGTVTFTEVPYLCKFGDESGINIVTSTGIFEGIESQILPDDGAVVCPSKPQNSLLASAYTFSLSEGALRAIRDRIYQFYLDKGYSTLLASGLSEVFYLSSLSATLYLAGYLSADEAQSWQEIGAGVANQISVLLGSRALMSLIHSVTDKAESAGWIPSQLAMMVKKTTSILPLVTNAFKNGFFTTGTSIGLNIVANQATQYALGVNKS